MDQGHDRGWCRYSFDEVAMSSVHAHGSSVAIRAASAIRRGPGLLQMSLMELPARGGADEAIGLHVHRDASTGRDVEEIYIVIAGECEMTFTSGDTVLLGPGDCVTTYPGTGHALRVVGSSDVRVVVVLPEAFRAGRQEPAPDPLPASFSPRIDVVAHEPGVMTPLEARCAECGAGWSAAGSDPAESLPSWAVDHLCVG